MTPEKTIPGTRRAKQKARTRELILESAKELFDKLGYQKTTIRAVAKGAGVGLGTVMSHFPDKRSLLIGAVLDFWQETEQRVYTSIAAFTGVRELFLYITKEFYAAYAAKPDLSRTLLKELAFVDGQQEDRPWGKVDEMLELAAIMVEQGKQTGEISPDADSASVGLALFANYMFVLHMGLSQIEVDVNSMVGMLEVLTDQLFNGIGGSTATAASTKGEDTC